MRQFLKLTQKKLDFSMNDYLYVFLLAMIIIFGSCTQKVCPSYGSQQDKTENVA